MTEPMGNGVTVNVIVPDFAHLFSEMPSIPHIPRVGERLILFDPTNEGEDSPEAWLQLRDRWEATVTQVTYDLSPWDDSLRAVIDEVTIEAEADPPPLRSDGQLMPVLDYMAMHGWGCEPWTETKPESARADFF